MRCYNGVPTDAVCAICNRSRGAHWDGYCDPMASPAHGLRKFKIAEVTVELRITKERVVAAAESCPDAKRVLAKLFPEVFNESKIVDSRSLTYDSNVGNLSWVLREPRDNTVVLCPMVVEPLGTLWLNPIFAYSIEGQPYASQLVIKRK